MFIVFQQKIALFFSSPNEKIFIMFKKFDRKNFQSANVHRSFIFRKFFEIVQFFRDRSHFHR